MKEAFKRKLIIFLYSVLPWLDDKDNRHIVLKKLNYLSTIIILYHKKQSCVRATNS